MGGVPGERVVVDERGPASLERHFLELTGQRVGDVVVVVGALPVDFTSFGVTMPTAPIVVSVEDSGDLEWQLFLTRAGDAVADEVTDGEGSDDPAADAVTTDDDMDAEETSEG